MSADSPFVLARAVVDTAERLSPSFIRITFGGPELADVGTPGHVLDQRIKLIFPAANGELPSLAGGADWYQEWLAVPEDERGSMRTYSIRELVVEGSATKVVVDFVLHLDPASSGPASLWANGASAGDELLLLGPRRGRSDGGGIEYSPGGAQTVLLAGDETAAPAIARILEDAAPETRGVAFIEVPLDEDVLAIDAPDGVEVRWLTRAERSHGELLLPAVLDYLGASVSVTISDTGTEDLLWETPTYSGLGENLTSGDNPDERYFWIAGESAVVTTLRRHLVKDLSIDRSQVAFMGYWRRGVAMRG
ncbi:siderophore-interacting protein [soil metagenome]